MHRIAHPSPNAERGSTNSTAACAAHAPIRASGRAQARPFDRPPAALRTAMTPSAPQTGIGRAGFGLSTAGKPPRIGPCLFRQQLQSHPRRSSPRPVIHTPQEERAPPAPAAPAGPVTLPADDDERQPLPSYPPPAAAAAAAVNHGVLRLRGGGQHPARRHVQAQDRPLRRAGRGEGRHRLADHQGLPRARPPVRSGVGECVWMCVQASIPLRPAAGPIPPSLQPIPCSTTY